MSPQSEKTEPLLDEARRERRLRIFVSSAFRGMEAEREELVRRVFPRIRAYCTELGVIFDEVDLRWGISAAESHERKTILRCFEEIDNCRPFFLGVIGNRYGWIPTFGDRNDISELLLRKGRNQPPIENGIDRRGN